MTSFLLTILAFNAHCPWPFVPFDTVASPQPTPPTTPHKPPILDLLDIFVFLANLATNLAYLASPPAQIITRASIWSSKSWSLPPLIQNARVTNLPNIHTLIWPRNPFLSTRPYLPLLLHLLYFPPIYMFLNVVSMWLFLNLMWLESYCVFLCVYVLFLLLNNYFYGNHLCLCVKLFIRFYSCVMFHSMNIPQFISSFFTWDV